MDRSVAVASFFSFYDLLGVLNGDGITVLLFDDDLSTVVPRAELAVVFGMAYDRGATGGPVIVPVAVAIYTVAVIVGKEQTAVGTEISLEIERIGSDD